MKQAIDIAGPVNRVLANIEKVLVGKRPWSVALSTDESKLYVVNGLSDDITVVDTAKAKAMVSIPVGRVPHTVVLTN